MKLYMFRTVLLSIIKSLFTAHSAMVHVIQVCRQLSSRSICSCSTAFYKPVWHVPLLSVQWINPWWWTDELSETCRVSWQNKFVELVHLVGFITKTFVTMHGHMNVKNIYYPSFSRLRIETVSVARISGVQWDILVTESRTLTNRRGQLTGPNKSIITSFSCRSWGEK